MAPVKMYEFRHSYKNIFKFFTDGSILIFLIPILISILIIGTIFQKQLGIYQADKLIFSPTIIWLGPLPLIGIPVIFALIMFSIILRFFNRKIYQLSKLGSNISHLGLVLLLLSGFLSSIEKKEGFIMLHAQEEADYFIDYYEKQLNLDTGLVKISENISNLKTGEIIIDNIIIDKIIENCKLDPKSGITEIPLDKESENNQACIIFNTGSSAKKWVKEYDLPTYIKTGEKTYIFTIDKTQHDLPFYIQLESFEKIDYPGSNIAKYYKSAIRIIDKSSSAVIEKIIELNKPVRYKNYNIYQSSYQGEASILAVTKNNTSYLTYISCLLISLGIIISIFTRMQSSSRLSS